MAGKTLKTDETTKRLNITFPITLLNELRVMAEKENRSLNNLIVTIVKNYVEGQK